MNWYSYEEEGYTEESMEYDPEFNKKMLRWGLVFLAAAISIASAALYFYSHHS